MQINRRTYFYPVLVTALVFSIVIPFYVSAQDVVKDLTLNDAIEETLENNRSIQLGKLDVGIASASYKETDAIDCKSGQRAMRGIIYHFPINIGFYSFFNRFIFKIKYSKPFPAQVIFCCHKIL